MGVYYFSFSFSSFFIFVFEFIFESFLPEEFYFLILLIVFSSLLGLLYFLIFLEPFLIEGAESLELESSSYSFSLLTDFPTLFLSSDLFPPFLTDSSYSFSSLDSPERWEIGSQVLSECGNPFHFIRYYGLFPFKRLSNIFSTTHTSFPILVVKKDQK